MDDEDAASAAQAENAFRREMSWAERASSCAWYRQYKAKHPERVGRGQAGLAAIRRLKAAGTRGAARNGNPRERSDQKSKSPCKNNGHANDVANDDQRANLNHGNNGHANGVANDDQTANLNHGNNGHANDVANDDQTVNLNHGNHEGETEGADRVRTFAEIVAAVIGVSTSTAKRMQRIFLNLNDEQIQVCDRLDLPLGAIDSIAALKDAGQRAALIDLIDYGTPFDKAWEKIAPDARRSTGKSRAREAAEARAAQERQSELSDDDWFTAHCAGTTNALADPARFKADALLFRRVVNACRLFGTAVQEALDEARRERTPIPSTTSSFVAHTSTIRETGSFATPARVRAVRRVAVPATTWGTRCRRQPSPRQTTIPIRSPRPTHPRRFSQCPSPRPKSTSSLRSIHRKTRPRMRVNMIQNPTATTPTPYPI